MGRSEDILAAEAATWLLENEFDRREKFRRERMRHYGLVRDLLLDKLDTHNMSVLEVGGGPMPVTDLIPFRYRDVVDPLTEAYSSVIPCPDHVPIAAEEMQYYREFDLVVTTNALDHVRDPAVVMWRIFMALKPGGFLAIECNENNASLHPHEAHEHDVTADWIHRTVDLDYETVWELNWAEHGYRYGWVLHEGKRGQPAFAMLLRKCSGYS